ncbi:hypothetical protein BH09SUM1_BH09SUM1_20770 [soil metagenome]
MGNCAPFFSRAIPQRVAPNTPGNPTENNQAKSILHCRLWLFAAVLFAAGFLYHPTAGWNPNSRLDLIFAIVDRGTFTIDDYHDTEPYATGDKAAFEGHFYSDKIIGVSLLGLPAYWMMRTLNGGAVDYHPAHYVIKAFAVSLPAAISTLLFLSLLIRTGTPPRRAVIITAVSFFGTMWFGYGTVFYPYIPGLACALGAFYLVLYPPANRLTAANCFAIGLLLGYSLLCDLIFSLLVLGLGVIWLMRLLDQVGVFGCRAFAEMTGDRSRLKHLVLFSASFWIGVLIPLSIFAAYTWSIFGEIAMPYRYEVDAMFRTEMSRGLMGATWPKPTALGFITFHPYRGIFFWSPVMLFGLAGCVIGTRQYGKRRILGWLGLWAGIAYLLFNAGYYQWWGGWGMGPRFLIPMIPFVLLGLGELARSGKLSAFANNAGAGPWAFRGAIAAGVLSVLLCAPLSMTDPQVPQGNQTEALLDAKLGDSLAIPQWSALRAFYGGDISISPAQRLHGIIASPDRAMNATWIAAYLAVISALLTMAMRSAPVEIPGMHRRDYPFRTVDGTAAPPPPIQQR